jgi:hypothetical protein
MRKVPHTAAEDLLELVMRCYERASTLLTSNRLCGAPHNRFGLSRHNHGLRIEPTSRRLAQAARRHGSGHRAPRPPAASRARPQVRTPELADQGTKVHVGLRAEEGEK